MMMQYLAETAAAADPMISSTVVTGIIGAITTLVVGVIGKLQLDKARNQTNDVTIKKPVPKIRTQEEPEFVTHQILNEHLFRIEKTFEEIKEALDGERGIARTANGNLHKRIDSMSERLGDRLAALEGSSRNIADTVGKLLDLALAKKPPGAR